MLDWSKIQCGILLKLGSVAWLLCTVHVSNLSSMDLPVAHSYESISGSAVDEYELNDISEEIHVRSQDEGAHEGLLRDENNREAFASV